ncbi:Metallo-hydrolase/oxidoreductase [Atractiella rhizophila]|nr:Metallo-hydrolase/oxidoreductase [Atractiella rhizophila]
MADAVQKLTPTVTLIRNSNPGPFTLTGTNTYLLQNSTDPSTYTSYIPRLLETIPAGGSITDVVISHWHTDHTGGIPSLFEALSSKVPKVWAHPALADHSSPINDDAFTPLRDGETFPPRPSLEIYHTPGHTKDSICLFDKEEGLLWTADTVLGQGTTVFENLGEYLSSLERMRKLVEDAGKEVQILPGHGPMVKEGLAKIKEYIDHRKLRENQIVSNLNSTPKTIEGLVAGIYPEVTDENVKLAAGRGVFQVLEVLKQRGVVEEVDGNWVLKQGKM